jgi:hypothetical protein
MIQAIAKRINLKKNCYIVILLKIDKKSSGGVDTQEQ